MTRLKGELFYYLVRLPKWLDRLEVIGLSDIHRGNPMFDEHSFKETIYYIKHTPEVRVIGVGDWIETVLRTSKGDIHTQVGSPAQQMKYVMDMTEPIWDKIIGMCIGNHELRVYNATGTDMSAQMANKIGCPYRAEAIYLKITFGDNNARVAGKPYSYYGYATHGYGGARTASAKAVKVERTSTHVHADFYMMAHDHVVNGAISTYLMPDNRTKKQTIMIDDTNREFETGYVKEKRKILVKTNACLKWGGYAEMGGFPPVDLTTPIIRLAGTGKPKVRVLI